MFTSYIPTLKAPSKNSSVWYKEFHNIFYLSQLTGLLLLSYLESFIDLLSKDKIIEIKEDYLLKNKIISKDGNILCILKEDEFKSIDIEDYLTSIIEDKIKKHSDEMTTYLSCLGLQPHDDLNKNINIDLKQLLKTTNAKNWYDVIKGFLNIWEFQFLYSSSETTLKKILNITGQTREEDLIKKTLTKFPELESKLAQELPLSTDAIDHFWSLFTEFRNIYSHSHGIITSVAKSNIGGKLNNFRNSFDLGILEGSWIETDNIFKNSLVKKDKIYLLTDTELNIFRNFVTTFMESLDEVYGET